MPPRNLLSLAEGLAVGALIHGGVGFVGAYQNLVQRTVVLGIAVVGAGPNGTFDALVGIAVHSCFLLFLGFCVSMSAFFNCITGKLPISVVTD